jgi:hypothetical protein
LATGTDVLVQAAPRPSSTTNCRKWVSKPQKEANQVQQELCGHKERKKKAYSLIAKPATGHDPEPVTSIPICGLRFPVTLLPTHIQ